MVVTPSGRVLPSSAQTLPGLEFDNVSKPGCSAIFGGMAPPSTRFEARIGSKERIHSCDRHEIKTFAAPLRPWR